MNITQEKLKKILHYNNNTGVFKWKVNIGNVKKGNIISYKSAEGYILIGIDNGRYFAHRLAWLYVYGSHSNVAIGHANHVKDDNRLCNLIEMQPNGNSKNRPLQSNNTSGFVGVNFEKETNKWRASISDKGKPIRLGRFADKAEAVKTRKEAETKYNYHKNHGKNSKIRNKLILKSILVIILFI